jgi:hypothetical protein
MSYDVSSIYRKAEFMFCYTAYKALWASRTPEEVYHAQTALKEIKKVYRDLHVISQRTLRLLMETE